MKSDILFVLPSFALGFLLFVVAFFVGDDIIVIGSFLFLGLIVFLEGVSSFLYILSNKAHCTLEDNQ